MVAVVPVAARLFALYWSTRVLSSRALRRGFRNESALRPGMERLTKIIDTLLVLQVVPFLFPSKGIQIILRGGAWFLCCFLATFRCLLWVAGRWPARADIASGGPITEELTEIQWHSLLFFPVEGLASKHTGKEALHGSYASSALRGVILSATIVALNVDDEAASGAGVPNGSSRSFQDTLWRHALYSLGLYTLLTTFQDLASVFMNTSLNLQTRLHFGNPFLSPGLAAFWSRRWNLPVQTLLRDLVYLPVLEGSFVAAMPRELNEASSSSGDESATVEEHDDGRCKGAVASRKAGRMRERAPSDLRKDANNAHCNGAKQRPPLLRQLFALVASFAVSGAMHEAAFVYIYGGPSSGLSWLKFFALQAPLIVLERVITTAARHQAMKKPTNNGSSSASPDASSSSATSVLLSAVPRALVTGAVIEACAGPLFWGPTEAAGMAQEIARDAMQPLTWW